MESRNTSQNFRNIKHRKTTGIGIAKESAYLPKIRSMRDYIEQHYKGELISELGRALARGEIPQLIL